MGRPFDRWLVLAIAAVTGGCGGKGPSTTTPDGSGGALGSGGQSIPDGTRSSGGASATGGAVEGGAPFVLGGTTALGGTRALGGTSSTVENPSGGHVTVSGGTTTTGGATIAGAGRSNGGANVNIGGHTGGNLATGGRSTIGGAIATGGTMPGGGTSTGGTTAATTGGTLTTAGTKATGGTSATGGTFSAAGSAAVWPKKFCGNTTTGNAVDPSGLNFAKHWDQITPENAGKWGSVQANPSTGAFNWSSLDALYAHAEQNGILFKEHTFVWGSAQPTGQNLATVELWIKSYCQRFPRTALIDVVNEPPPHTTPYYATALGQGESGKFPWITKSFKLARQYCGNAVLILNDYGNIEYESQEDHFIDIVKDIIAAGAPIDAVGAQAHDAYKLTASQLQANLEKLATQTGLPVYITEYDVNLSSDSAQYDVFAAQFPIFWNASYVRGVTVWGWIMGKTWLTNTGLVKDTTPRPAMAWLMDYLGRPSPP